jgi:hypothetical protein
MGVATVFDRELSLEAMWHAYRASGSWLKTALQSTQVLLNECWALEDAQRNFVRQPREMVGNNDRRELHSRLRVWSQICQCQ